MDYLKGNSNAWIDISKKKYGRLTVLGYVGNGKWECVCECGNKKVLRTGKITTLHTKSCGCLSKTNALKHGGIGSREYNIWANMKARCNNINNTSYKNYGGRGITICDEWNSSFEKFIKDMGPCPKNYSIDRINNELGYSIDNCKWSSNKEQSLNRRSNFIITHNGITKPLKEMCEIFKKDYKKTFARLSTLGWSVEKAFNQ
jgi:hypothetical protein